ncbi:conserved hypothetical protein [Culex quinquefasciatus]|uniref:FAS1 domain-containing protein n=1 Tax=Culex quinquefasciatus TaxID=7176 RepID=B0WC16_CULQU|nr:conserved hypothetical protein [Culex quinquefasciatus]|eukprot:XP_001846250.1 conserved hypothetical protein [Culex quinquefasciatus]
MIRRTFVLPSSAEVQVSHAAYAGCSKNVNSKIQRRQLTQQQLSQQQQTHILSDIQQHQHRFNLHQGQRPPSNVIIQPSIQLPVPSQQLSQLNQRPFSNSNNPFQSPPVLPPQFNGKQLPPQLPPNNFRPPQSSRQPHSGFGAQPSPHHNSPHNSPSNLHNTPPSHAPQAQALFQAPPQTQQFQPAPQATFGQPIVQQPFDTNHIRSEVVPLNQQPLQTSNFNPFANQQQQQQQQQSFNSFPPVQNLPVFAPTQTLNSQPGVFPQIQPAAAHISQQQTQLSFQQQQELENRLKEESVRIRELQEKQKIIQKHEQFLQKQYQKQQAKVQQLHQEFLKKQQNIIQQQQDYETIRKTPTVGLQTLPSERTVYEKATKAYQKPSPTTTTAYSTTTQRNLAVIPLKSNSKKDYSTISKTDLDALLQSNRFQTVRTESPKPTKARPPKAKSTKALGRDELLKQLKLALAEQGPQELGNRNFSATDLVLPNGEKVQVIRTTDPEIIKRANVNSEAVLTQQLDTPTTAKPLSFEDIAKSGILPPGADFELIKQSEDGQIEDIGKIPPQKKVTFVYLEEQDDGSYKVQGVKGSADKETKTSGADVDSILKRIKNGEIQLPPPSNKAVKTPIVVEGAPSSTTPRIMPVQKANSVTIIPHSTPLENHYPHSTNFVADHTIPRTASSPSSTTYISTASPSSPSPVSAYSPSTYSGSTIPQSSSTYVSSTQSPITNYYPVDNTLHYTGGISSTYPTTPSPIPTATPVSPSSTTAHFSTRSENYIAASTLAQQTASSTIYQQQQTAAATGKFDLVHPTVPAPEAVPVTQQQEQALPLTQQPQPSSSSSSSSAASELPAILKKNGLFAMAKYLRQSGLDTILNETGPYTIFVPTDKAFRSPPSAAGRDRRRPRKSSRTTRDCSLLLHHVIPGSFDISSLQDEMTGVSLAGTQLRVNQYNMHDSEWNDVKVTTINGAMVVLDKQDITIPQGIAHAVDRVMFPLPVGDILQTLQSDRERRFTHFLRALYASGMSDTLQNKGIKTYTVFAPTDAAFANYSTDELNKLVTDKDQAEELVKKHVVPGTLFTAGMRFYQVKDAMAEGKTVTLQKSAGKIKINDGYLQTSNIPTTNGVIHAVDALL